MKESKPGDSFERNRFLITQFGMDVECSWESDTLVFCRKRSGGLPLSTVTHTEVRFVGSCFKTAMLPGWFVVVGSIVGLYNDSN